MPRKIESRTMLENKQIELGIYDNKGRTISYSYHSYKIILVESSDSWGYTRPAGTYYVASFQGLRDGEKYGALTKDAWCNSIEELDAEIKRRVKTFTDRQMKIHGGE